MSDPKPPKAGPRPAQVSRGECVHYAGMFDSDMDEIYGCHAGVVYRDILGTKPLACLPCTPQRENKSKYPHTSCDKCKFPADDAIEAFEKWSEAHTLILMYAALLCRLDAGKRTGIRGEIECPECDGRLRYTVSGSNGHLWGSCQTEGCLAWLQ